MTGFNNNNKFVPTALKTFQVIELRDQQQPVKKSGLSVAARSKVINRSGSNYLSEKEGYGPCDLGHDGCSITAILICTNGKSKSERLDRPVSAGEGSLVSLVAKIDCGWGIWADEYDLISVRGTNSFAPSYTARRKLIDEIWKTKDKCGHQTVAVTDKEEWKQ